MSGATRRICIVAVLLTLSFGVSCGDNGNGGGDPPVFTLSQNGVTWGFDREVTYGTYANGDYWVVGPVTITSITPDGSNTVHDLGADICTGGYTSRDCSDRCSADYPGSAALCSEGSEPDSQGDCYCQLGRSGWEVNPAAGRVTSAFDSRVGHQSYDHRLTPALPYTAQPGQSLVKAVSREEDLDEERPSVRTASVLTIVAEPPPDGGATVFRPPYVGAEKPHYSVEDLRVELLAALPALPNMPTWEAVQSHVRYVQLEHIAGRPGVIIRPQEHLYYYAPENGGRRAEVALRLLIDEPEADRHLALVYFVQAGIDMLYALRNGQQWGAGGGEYPGMKLIMLMSAVLLDEPELISSVESFFAYEDEAVVLGVDGQGLWGHLNHYQELELAYWSDVVNEQIEGASPSRKTIRDPYGYIDGGTVPGTGYQICCSIQSFKGTSLVMQLMPELMTHWDIPALHDYVDRMVSHGTLAQPDPCAPADPADIAAGIGIDDPSSNYGITFGPDGAGGCIPDTDASDGIGRFPDQDGVEQDPRGYHGSSDFVHAMYEAYR